MEAISVPLAAIWDAEDLKRRGQEKSQEIIDHSSDLSHFEQILAQSISLWETTRT